MNISSDDAYLSWGQLSYMDRLAYFVSQVVYGSSINADLVSSSLIVSIAVLIVWVGSFSTLGRPRNAIIEDKKLEKNENWDPSDIDNCLYLVANREHLDMLNDKNFGFIHVVSLPFVEGGALLLLNLIMNKWDSKLIEKVFNWFFVLNGWIFTFPASDYILGSIFRKFIRIFGKKTSWLLKRYRLCLVDDVQHFPLGTIENITPESLNKNKYWFEKFQEYLRNNNIEVVQPTPIDVNSQVLNWVFDLKFLIVAPFSILMSYLFYKHSPVLNSSYPFKHSNWLVTDIFSVLVSMAAIKNARFTNFMIGFIALIGLFFYDIYFVFHTDIMLKVASGIDSPIKLVFPREAYSEFYENVSMSILGLGDIIVPGMLISTCLRFDLFLHHQNNPSIYHRSVPFTKTYFYVSISCYIIGLLVTLLMLHTYNFGQPALLYIVPSILLGIVGTTFFKGTWKEIREYDEEIEEFVFSEDPQNIDTDEDDEEEDDDYNYQEPNDSYDAWEDHVENKRSGVEENLTKMIVYEFGDTDDEMDDTFVIESESESDDDDDPNLGDTDDDITSNALEILTNDISREPKEWYSDEE